MSGKKIVTKKKGVGKKDRKYDYLKSLARPALVKLVIQSDKLMEQASKDYEEAARSMSGTNDNYAKTAYEACDRATATEVKLYTAQRENAYLKAKVQNMEASLMVLSRMLTRSNDFSVRNVYELGLKEVPDIGSTVISQDAAGNSQDHASRG